MDKDFIALLHDVFASDSNDSSNLEFDSDDLVKICINGNIVQKMEGVFNLSEDNNYTSNFGDQWLKFRHTQLDSYNGTSLSESRFFDATGWSKESLKGRLILDVGCGAGRFAEIALKYGAFLVAIDYSDAVYATSKNLEAYTNKVILKANIYDLPFSKGKFDKIYCLGVIQHTPDPESAFKVLPELLKKDGELCCDFYWKRFREYIKPKYYVRAITKYFTEQQIYKFLIKFHPFLYFLSNLISYVPLLGKYLKLLVPIKNYKHDYPELNKVQLIEWSFLDTYDNWAPKYDYPQTKANLEKWANDMELKNVKIFHAAHLVLRCNR